MLNTQEIQIIKGKAKGKTNTQIAKEVYPDIKPESARVQVQRKLRNATVQSELQKELSRQGITLKLALAPIKDGLKATKYATIEGDFYNTELPEHTTRLQASRMALDLLDRATPSNIDPVDTGKIAIALESGTEHDLLGVIFGKKTVTSPTQTEPLLVDSKQKDE